MVSSRTQVARWSAILRRKKTMSSCTSWGSSLDTRARTLISSLNRWVAAIEILKKLAVVRHLVTAAISMKNPFPILTCSASFRTGTSISCTSILYSCSTWSRLSPRLPVHLHLDSNKLLEQQKLCNKKIILFRDQGKRFKDNQKIK